MEKTKFTNTKKTIYSAILILSLILSAFSCGNITGGTKRKSSEPQKEKAYLSILVKNISATSSASREAAVTETNVNTIKELSVENLSDLVLTGKLGDATEAETLLEADTVADLTKDAIELDAGRWEFTLSAKLNGIVFSGTKTYTIVAGKNNEVGFVLKPTEHFGGYEIIFDVTGSAVTHYSATLKKVDTDQVIEEILDESVTISYTSKKITLERDILDTTKRLASGTYELDVKFYNGALEEVLNSWTHYITITDGTVLTATIDLEYNNVYTITYQGDEGATIIAGMEIKKFSARSSFDLPVLKKDGYFFKGWYRVEDGNTTETKITKISAGTQSDISVLSVSVFSDPLRKQGLGPVQVGGGGAFADLQLFRNFLVAHFFKDVEVEHGPVPVGQPAYHGQQFLLRDVGDVRRLVGFGQFAQEVYIGLRHLLFRPQVLQRFVGGNPPAPGLKGSGTPVGEAVEPGVYLDERILQKVFHRLVVPDITCTYGSQIAVKLLVERTLRSGTAPAKRFDQVSFLFCRGGNHPLKILIFRHTSRRRGRLRCLIRLSGKGRGGWRGTRPFPTVRWLWSSCR